MHSFTNEVGDNTAIANSTSGVFEEGLPIGPEVCCGAIDEDIVSSVKEGVSKDEQCRMFLRHQLSKASGWNEKAGGTKKGQYAKRRV